MFAFHYMLESQSKFEFFFFFLPLRLLWNIRIPIKSKIIEYSSGFVKDRPDKECADLYVIGFEAIDVILSKHVRIKSQIHT